MKSNTEIVRMEAAEVLRAIDEVPHSRAGLHDPVNHPAHYTSHPSGIECLEVTRLMSFSLGNATKYVWRYTDKGKPAEDLDKARFYLRDALEWGSCHYPSHKAHHLLRRVIEAETDPLRAELLGYICEGDLSSAIATITDTLCWGD